MRRLFITTEIIFSDDKSGIKATIQQFKKWVASEEKEAMNM